MANSAAIIGAPTVSDVTEDTNLQVLIAAGLISITDANAGQAAFKTTVISASGNLGSLTITANGAYSYSVADSAVQYLGTGDTKIDTFTVTSVDGTTKKVSFTIHGVNDTAVIGTAITHDVTEDATRPNLTATGSISISDVDQGEASFKTSVISFGGNLGTLTLGTNGSYSYSVANNAVQYLGAGDTKVDTFTVTSNDGTTKQISFTIHGVNDAAVIGTPTVHDVTEDATNPLLTANGMISITDADQGQAAFKTSVISASGNLGNLTIAANGSYGYSVADSAVRYLGAGDTKVDTFTVTSLDGTTKQVSFTIHGVNDAAVIGTPTVHDVTEDATQPLLYALGTISISDADQGEAAFQLGIISGAGALGTLILLPNGAYAYFVSDSAVQYLGANDVKVDTFTVTAVDGTTKQISFTIHGTNDVAAIGAPTVHDVTEDSNPATLTATGSIAISDADQGQAAFQATVVSAASNLGTLTLAANGSYNYTVANSATQYLGASDTKTDTFTIASVDGTTKQVTFTIHGVNDAAVIGTPTVHDVTADPSLVTLTANGSISISDADQGQAFFKLAVTSASSNLGHLTLASNGSYSYTVAESAAAQLGTGGTKVDTFTVTSLDGTTKQITFTVHGASATSHAATIGDPTIHDVTEDTSINAGNLTAIGSISISDPDAGQAAFLSASGATGNLGSLVLSSNGNYTYTVANSAVQNLGAADTKVDTFTVTSVDNTTKQVSFTIHGSNDAAVIGDPLVHDVTEDAALNSAANLTATGTLTIADPDQNQNTFQTTVTGPASNLGSLSITSTGAYTYAVANSATQSLGANDTKVDTFTVTALDGTPKQVSFTIHGANDAAVIGGVHTGDATEDAAVVGGKISATGVLTVQDVDQGQAHFAIQTTAAGAHGTFALDANGNWSYAADDSQAAIQQLGDGQTLTDSFTAVSQDGSASQVVTVTIHGTDDAPIASPVTLSAGTEGASYVITQAALLSGVTDIDSTSLSITSLTVSSGGGSLHDNGDHSWTYTPDTYHNGQISFDYTVSDGSLSASSTAGFILAAVATQPVVTTARATAYVGQDIALNITVADPDASDTLASTVTISGVPNGEYKLNLGSPNDDGIWTVNRSDLSGLKLQYVGSALQIPETITLHVSATSTDGASTALTARDLNVQISDPAKFYAVDGYISDALVFIDKAGTGSFVAGDPFAYTAGDGSFSLDTSGGPVILQGVHDGVHDSRDVLTGFAFNGILKAPTGSTVVTPLTTLIVAVAGTGDVAAAESTVKASLGLSGDVDLKTLDPVAGTLSNAPGAAAVLAASIQVQATVTQLSAATGVSADDVVSKLATQVSGGNVDLGDSLTIGALASAVNPSLTSTDLTAISLVVSGSNTSISSGISSSTDLTGVAQASQVAFGSTTQALTDAQTSGTGFDQVATDYTGVALAAKIAAAPLTITGTAASDVLVGGAGDDSLSGLGGNDILTGGAGDDHLDGGAGSDRAIYSDATGGVTIDLTAGTASGAGVGSDTLTSIEAVTGSDFADTFSAVGFTGSSGIAGRPSGLDDFEGKGGDDIIHGTVNASGQILTRISYVSAAAAVTVDIAAGTAHGTAAGDAANVGNDTFTNVNAVIGSAYDDTLLGSNNPNASYEQYDGRAGNDFIDGRGGYDFAVYNNDATTTSGITVHLAAGTVTGDATVGTDTLRSVEAIRGTNFADTYDATGFSATSTNAGSLGTFNNFDGQGGNDTIIGNGNTRIQYSNSAAAVTVDIAAGTAHGTAAGDVAQVGTDTFSGVNAVMGSVFDDTLLGSNITTATETFMGLAGNDFIDGRGGFDVALYSNLTYTTGAISVDMASGTVTGDASNGTDTLRSIEGVQGTIFNDTYVATNFGAAGFLITATNNVGNNGNFNQFEGLAGNDSITGNGNTRVIYSSAGGGVTVNLQAGTATGDASVGTDTYVGVNSATGSAFNDTYNAAGFTGITSAGSFGTFNLFEGLAGNDTITGNGNTRIAYSQAAGAVTVDLSAGTAHGTAAGDVANVGTDTITGGVNSVQGSNFADLLIGGSAGETFIGGAGNDTINGGGGNDNITGGANNDTIDGGTGTDVAVFSGPRGSYTFSGIGTATVTVTDTRNASATVTPDGTDTLTNVEVLQFSDQLLLSASGTAINPVDVSALSFPAGPLTGTAGDDDLTIGVSMFNRAIDLGAGNNTVTIGAGSGTLNLTNVQHLVGSVNNNFVAMANDVNGMTIDLGAGSDTVNLANGVNSVSVTNVENLDGSDFTIGGVTSNDTLTILNNVSGITVNLGLGVNTLNLTAGANSFDNLFGVNTIHGSDSNDTLSDSSLGGVGTINNDMVIDLGAGDDTLIINGNYDNFALLNTEHLVGGAQDNYVVLNADVTGLTVDLGGGNNTLDLAGGINSVSVTNVQNIDTQDGIIANPASNDTLTLLNDVSGLTVNLQQGTNTLNLAAGTNALTTYNIQTINGSATGDSLTLLNSNYGVTIDLGGGTDTLTLSNNSNDVTVRNIENVIGGDGNDNINIADMTGTVTVTGGLGNDSITLGGSHDNIRFTEVADSGTNSGTDTVTNFDVANDAFVFDHVGGLASGIHFVSSGVLEGTAGNPQSEAFLNGNLLEIDVDGDGHIGAGDMLVYINGINGTLTDANFVTTGVDHRPTDIQLSGATVAENSSNGFVVGSLTATDPDAGDSATFSLTDNAGGLFAISGNNLVVNGPINYEAAQPLQVTVRVTDSGGLSYDKTFVIGVTDVNEAPTAVVLSNQIVFALENGGDVKVADIAITDDALGINTLSLSGADAASFTIVNGNELHFVGGANFEAKAFYDVTVNANDALASNHVAPDASQSFHLIITDVNEAPTITSGATANVAENAPITTVVYQALASDQDVIPPNNIITWSLTGTDAAAFSISPTGQVTLNASANYEVKNSYSINVVATDGGVLFDSKAVTIGIIDVNEAPTAVVLSGQVTSTTENGGDVKVANIAITDDALGSNVLSLSGADAASFTIVNGNELHFVGGVNFEAKTGYDVTVNVNDAGASNHVAPDASQNFHLAITNVNEAPTDISLSNNTIGQSTANGTVIGVLSTVDPDAGDTATFSFVSNPGNQFGISGGNLVVAGALTAGAQQIIVRDTDSGGLSFDKTLTINVSSGATIVGDANANTLVGTAGDDLIQGLAGNDRLQGMAGNDTLDGGVGFDRAVYSEATGGITANLAAGTVSGPGVGTDMLINIEGIVGSAFADNLTAAGFAGDSGVVGTNVGFNEIEGGAGDDTITGATNSQGAPLTRISYVNASSAVTVNLAAHTATGGDGNDNLVGSGFSGIVGSRFDDTLTGTNNGPGTVEVFEGRAGNDTLNGAGGFDRADYALDPTTTSGITVNMVAGTVVGDRQAVGDTTVGSDTLVSIEAVRGTNFADSYTATGFSGSGVNPGNNGTFNEFNGMGGNDIIVGNGNTRIAFVNAVAAVTVDMQTSTTPETGTAVGDLVSTGSDSFSGVNAVMGSMFDDTIRGSNITTSTETFTGLAGNDLIDGRGGFDIASYNNIYFSTGPVTVNMGAGTATGDASIGSDTLLSIEAIQGTNFNDVYNASTYGTNAALNIGNNGTFNQFEGLGGNDTITGNSNTRIGYFNATAGVTVNIATGTATGDTSVGTDTFTGVNSVTGSAFSDTIIGDGNSNTLTGGGSNDTIDGGSGADLALFTGAKGGYTISLNTPSAGQVQVQDGTANRDGMDTLTNIEVLQFSDQSDLIASGSSGSPIDLSDNRLFFGATTNQFNVLTGSNNDFVKIGFSLSGHVINLGAGTGDTVILGQTGSYNLNLVNVENVVGSSGDDSINLTNIASGLSIDLGNGNDTVNLAVGTNSLSVAHVEQLNSTDFSGIASNDTLNLLNDVSGITVNLAQGDNTLNLAAGANSFNSIFNVQHINGTGLDDTLTIGTGLFEPGNNPTVDLGAGNNTLNFGGGTLSLLNVQHLNGDGSDNFVTLNNDVNGLAVDLGGGTNDNLNLAVGNNSLSVTNVENVSSSDWSGAASDDTLTLLSTVTGGVTINLQQGSNTLNLAAGSNTFDNLWNIDHVNGTSSNDTLTIQGGGAGAAIDLGDGNDTLNLNGGSFGVTISNVETINGSAFSDNFTISNVVTGSTTVTAGAGADVITASAGQDNFHFASVADSTINGQTDTIVNFDAVHDTFTFAGIAVTGGSIDYVGAGAFEIGHASATLQNVGPGNDVLNIDIDGNGVMDSADMVISLTNLQGPLHSSNFLLA